MNFKWEDSNCKSISLIQSEHSLNACHIIIPDCHYNNYHAQLYVYILSKEWGMKIFIYLFFSKPHQKIGVTGFNQNLRQKKYSDRPYLTWKSENSSNKMLGYVPQQFYNKLHFKYKKKIEWKRKSSWAHVVDNFWSHFKSMPEFEKVSKYPCICNCFQIFVYFN